jgi:hypothetical protein
MAREEERFLEGGLQSKKDGVGESSVYRAEHSFEGVKTSSVFGEPHGFS